MDGCDKVLSSSTPTKRPVTPNPSASDENNQYYQQMGKSTLQSPKKPMTKNYMSPTISASSKAIASRKNILGERNEALEPDFPNTHVEKSHLAVDNGNYSLSQALQLSPSVFQSHDDERNEALEPDFSNTHVEKSHVAVDNGNDSLSQALPLTPSVFQSHDDDGDKQNVLSDGLASRPYDPVTNYLSPRPQFLRYKPNRRHELFLGLQNGVAGKIDGLSMSRSGSFESQKDTDEETLSVTTPSSLDSPHLKQRDEEVEGSDEKIKGSDEKIEGGDLEIKGSDEEIEGSDEKIGGRDEESDEEYEEVEEEKCWNLKGLFKNLLLWLVIGLFASHISTMNNQTPFEGVEDMHCSIQNNTLEAALLKKLESGSNMWDQPEERRIVGLVEEIKRDFVMGVGEPKTVEYEIGSEVMGHEVETEIDLMGVEFEDENLGSVENADEVGEVLELQDEEIEVIEVTEQEKKEGIDELGEVVVLQVEEISYQMAENSDQMSGEVDHFDLGSNSFEEEEGEVAVKQIDGMVESKVEDLAEYFTNMADEPVMSETMNNDDNTGFDEILDFEAEGNWREELINHMKSKTFYTAVVGVSIFSVIVAFLVSVFCVKQRNGVKKDSSVIANPACKPLVIEQKKIDLKVSSPPLKRYPEPVIVEKHNSVLLKKEDDSSFRRLSLSSKHSTGAASEEIYHSQAPTVELLGEFVVGEVSSSLRTCSMKNKTTESEESNYSVSSKKLGSKAHSVSFQAQPTVSEFSSMDSPSHGSYITPQKIMKEKVGGKDGEVTTPLRRSSRLRNRVMSP